MQDQIEVSHHPLSDRASTLMYPLPLGRPLTLPDAI